MGLRPICRLDSIQIASLNKISAHNEGMKEEKDDERRITAELYPF